MAWWTSKVKVLTCSVMLLCLMLLIVCLSVFVRGKCSYAKAAVAADSKTCSDIGRSILLKGGSAVDSAIAALLCTSVVNPQSMGLGGGAIFTVMDATGKVKIINCRERAPSGVKADLTKRCPKTFKMMTGSTWIGVPGELRCYETAHRLYGKLPWASLFQPTIHLAKEGIRIPAVQGRYISHTNTNETQALRRLFSDPDGNLLKTGDVIKFEKLAKTLEEISNHGAETFYSGKIAEDLIQDIQEAGGGPTLEDLSSYRVSVTDAWAFPLGEYQMYIPPPPSGGVLLSLVLNIMKDYYLDSSSLKKEQNTLFYHRYVEALKFVNGLKKHIRDPEFSSKDMGKKLTEDSFANRIRSLISVNRTHDTQYYNITPHVDSIGTTHVSVLAEDGSAVSVTSTINHIFGSKVLSERTGVILNNQLYDFCGKVDHIFPGEQPPSSMSPAVLRSKSRTLVIGSTGGAMITTAMASAIINHLWFRKSLKDAIAAPVVYVDSLNTVNFESTFNEDVKKEIKALGHIQGAVKNFYNVVNAVEREDHCIEAWSDTRKHGEASGY